MQSRQRSLEYFTTCWKNFASYRGPDIYAQSLAWVYRKDAPFGELLRTLLGQGDNVASYDVRFLPYHHVALHIGTVARACQTMESRLAVSQFQRHLDIYFRRYWEGKENESRSSLSCDDSGDSVASSPLRITQVFQVVVSPTTETKITLL